MLYIIFINIYSVGDKILYFIIFNEIDVNHSIYYELIFIDIKDNCIVGGHNSVLET